MSLSALTVKGQTTIPKDIRDLLKLSAGDRIEFVVRNGEVLIKPARSDIAELRGLLKKPGSRPVSVDEMNQAVKRAAARSFK